MLRTNLVLGCGKREKRHSSSDWLSIDNKPAIKPEIVSSISDNKLLEKMAKEGFIPGSFKVIHSENISMEELTHCVFIDNVHSLLMDNGVLIINNLFPYDLLRFTEKFKGLVFRFANITLLTKTKLDLSDIINTLQEFSNEIDDFAILKTQIESIHSHMVKFKINDSFIEHQTLIMYYAIEQFLHHADTTGILNAGQKKLLLLIASKLSDMLVSKDFSGLSLMMLDLCKQHYMRDFTTSFNTDKWDEDKINDVYFDELNHYSLRNLLHTVMALACVMDPSLQTKLDDIKFSCWNDVKQYTQTNWCAIGIFAVAATVAASTLIIDQIYKKTMNP